MLWNTNGFCKTDLVTNLLWYTIASKTIKNMTDVFDLIHFNVLASYHITHLGVTKLKLSFEAIFPRRPNLMELITTQKETNKATNHAKVSVSF